MLSPTKAHRKASQRRGDLAWGCCDLARYPAKPSQVQGVGVKHTAMESAGAAEGDVLAPMYRGKERHKFTCTRQGAGERRGIREGETHLFR